MRLLFTCYPGIGHLHPMLPLARAATRAGHDVVIATGRDVAGRAEAQGFTAWPAGLASDEIAARYLARFPESNALPPAERLRQVVPRMFIDIAARAMLGDLRGRVEAWRPDAVVHDQSELAGAILAATLGVPTAVHSWGPMMPAELRRLAEPAAAALAEELGMGDVVASVAEATYIDICPPSLQLSNGTQWRRIQPVRHEDPAPAAGEALPEAVPRLPRRDAVYVTLGTVNNKAPGVFEAVLAGASDLDVNLIVTVGRDVDPARLGPQPAHVVVERYIPQTLVLGHCRAVVAHSGAGTMLGALAHGAPLLLLPIGAEQFINAEACRRAGAALVLQPDEVTPAAVRAGLARVLAEESFAAAARRLGDEIARMPSADEALGQLF